MILCPAICGSEETRNFEECPASGEENLVTHQKLSLGDALVHNEALLNYLEQEDESTPAEKNDIEKSALYNSSKTIFPCLRTDSNPKVPNPENMRNAEEFDSGNHVVFSSQLQKSELVHPRGKKEYSFSPDAASSVAQINQGRVPGLGRGPGSKNILQSPRVDKTLKILQCNINGISSQASRIKLDQLLDLAERLSAQIAALQETKLRKTTPLKARGYSVFRTDRGDANGGGLALLIRDIKYRAIDIQTDENTDMEIQGISFVWRDRPKCCKYFLIKSSKQKLENGNELHRV
ncbi:hypothetical protein AVEN_272317-1 [Araneus ventricosus]|uniref:Endonuclease/exonuclease/phosphatase domain-containing protein n=1 Tax=Araneus ventricosus TaxID=182803 RepID=A0A4Y2IYR6_ARAVE|nr:hypothetical protein AVEN_272317-1 [Araneus ventricosus]